jgi:hypothetical protein
MHHDARASSAFTLYSYGPALVSHDAIGGGEPEPISLSGLLGGEKGLEQAGTGFGVHAAARVADGELDPGIAELLLLASWSGCWLIVVPGGERDPAALRHGVARVQNQVQNDLLNLGRIHLHQAEITRQIGNEFDVLADQPGEQITHFRDRIVQGEQARLNRPLLRHRHQLLDEPRPLLPRRADLLGETP